MDWYKLNVKKPLNSLNMFKEIVDSMVWSFKFVDPIVIVGKKGEPCFYNTM